MRIARGDVGAVEPCLRQHGALVWSLARRMTSSQADAEDAVQDIFAELWRSAGRFDPERGSERTFIATIARRRLIDRIRRQRRERDQRSFDVQLDTLPSLRADARGMEASLEAGRVAAALSDLPEERRRVLRLSLVEGMSHAQIAEALDIPLGTVKSHARRGLATVRAVLAEPSGEPKEGGLSS